VSRAGDAGRRDLAVTIAAGLLVAALLFALPHLRTCGRSPASVRRRRVTHVYDGDTVQVAGIAERVRFVGVDALDGHNKDKARRQAERYGLSAAQVQYWAREATEFLQERLEGREVVLRRGAEDIDGYGRRLFYVHEATQDGEAGADVNLQLLERGLAVAYHGFPHPRLERYLQAEQRAWEQRRGLWADARRGP
jgi:endonuclease YncB( thermonuclease family)